MALKTFKRDHLPQHLSWVEQEKKRVEYVTQQEIDR